MARAIGGVIPGSCHNGAIDIDDPHSCRGRLLIATPVLRDAIFDRTVIFVLEHGPEGALGVVINRPSHLPVEGTIDEWAEFAAAPPKVFIGGPVSPSSVIALATVDRDDPHDASNWNPIIGRLGTVDLERMPEEVAGLDAVRMFAGYAGWEAGQLDSELALDSWYVVDVEVEDLHDPHPEGLWTKILSRQSGALGRLRNYPEDPWVN